MTEKTDLAPSPQPEKMKTPWKAPMYTIIFGIFFSGYGIRAASDESLGMLLLALEYILPLFGNALFFLGLFTLRKRQKAFQYAAYFAAALLAINLFVMLWDVTPIGGGISLLPPNPLVWMQLGFTSMGSQQLMVLSDKAWLCTLQILINIVSAGGMLAFLLALRQLKRAVTEEFQKYEIRGKARVYVWLAYIPLLVCLGAGLAGFMFLYALVAVVPAIIIHYIWIYTRMFQITKELNRAGTDLEDSLAETKNLSTKTQWLLAAAFAAVVYGLLSLLSRLFDTFF